MAVRKMQKYLGDYSKQLTDFIVSKKLLIVVIVILFFKDVFLF